MADAKKHFKVPMEELVIACGASQTYKAILEIAVTNGLSKKDAVDTLRLSMADPLDIVKLTVMGGRVKAKCVKGECEECHLKRDKPPVGGPTGFRPAKNAAPNPTAQNPNPPPDWRVSWVYTLIYTVSCPCPESDELSPEPPEGFGEL